MPTKAEDCLYELLVMRDDFASDDQVDRALSEQRRRQRRGDDASLERVLLDLGFLDAEEATTVRSSLSEEVIPGYRLHEEIGRGGMGTVYRATQLSMERDVAVKVLSRRLSRDKKFCLKFLQEARNAAKLNHENVMGGIDCGEASGLHYFVMEFVDGKTLTDVLEEQGPLSPERAFAILEQAARGLKHAHGQHIVHRDIKPENIMLTRDQVVKICDLGLARPEKKAGEGFKGATCEGTPDYCAPEQALGRTDIDAKADIYALGASMYHILVGRPPYTGENARKLLWHQVHTPFPNPRDSVPALTAAQNQLLLAMVEKKRPQRLASCDALLEQINLNRRSEVESAPRRRASFAARGSGGAPVGLLAVLTVVVLGLAALSQLPPSPTEEPSPRRTARRDTTPGTVRTSPATTSTGPKPRPVNVNIDRKLPTPGQKLTPKQIRSRQAKELLGKARDYEAAYPKDLEVIIARFREVTENYPGSEAARNAQTELSALTRRSSEQFRGSYKLVERKARDLMDAGRFTDANTTLESFRETHDVRLIKDYEAPIELLRQRCFRLARRELDGLKAGLEQWARSGDPNDSPLFTGLANFKTRAPASLVKEAEGAEATARDASRIQLLIARFSGIQEQANIEMKRGQLGDARGTLLTAREDPVFTAIKAHIEEQLARLDRIAASWRQFDDNANRLVGQTTSLPYRAEEAQKVTVREYRSTDSTLLVKIFGRKEERTLRLDQLEVSFLLGLYGDLSTSQRALEALEFFSARGLLECALACLTKAREHGHDDPALAKRLEVDVARRRETVAKRLVDQCLADRQSPETVTRIQRLAREFATSPAYLAKHSELCAAYTEARSLALVAQPEQLFRGKLTLISEKSLKVKLQYDFDDPEEIKDWAIETETLKDSAAKYVAGQVEVTGKLKHSARFAPGPLKVEFRLRPKDRNRPNFNVMLNDQGGRDGLFVGVATRMNANNVTVSKEAAKNPGLRVKLPANLVADVKGTKWRYVYADKKPAFSGDKTVRFIVERRRSGGVQAKINGRTMVKLNKAPRADQSGHVGLYLDKVKLYIDRVTFEGQLEAGWVATAAHIRAQMEAALLPGAPPPKQEPKPGDNKG